MHRQRAVLRAAYRLRVALRGYTGTLQRWAAVRYGLTLDVVYPTRRQLKRYAPDLLPALGYTLGFHVLPRRWVVERTL